MICYDQYEVVCYHYCTCAMSCEEASALGDIYLETVYCKKLYLYMKSPARTLQVVSRRVIIMACIVLCDRTITAFVWCLPWTVWRKPSNPESRPTKLQRFISDF